MDIPSGEATVKSPVAVVHEDGVIQRLNYPCLPGHARQIFVMLFNLRPQQEARFVLFDRTIVRQFLAAGLHGKISLSQCDERFAWIGILDDEITRATGQRQSPSSRCAPEPIPTFSVISTKWSAIARALFVHASCAFVITAVKLRKSEYSKTRANSRADQNSPPRSFARLMRSKVF